METTVSECSLKVNSWNKWHWLTQKTKISLFYERL